MELSTAVTAAWSSGISMYFVAAVLGVGARLDWLDAPTWLQEPWVISAAVALGVVELVVDKVAWLDSGWDAVHTFLRPVAGAALFSSTGEDADLWRIAAGAGLALSAHAAKATVRALVNTSPEPVSNVLVSLTEDGLVVGLMTLALTYPAAAMVISLVLAAISVVTAFVLVRTVRRSWRRWRDRRRARPGRGPSFTPTP